MTYLLATLPSLAALAIWWRTVRRVETNVSVAFVAGQAERKLAEEVMST